MRGLVAGAAGLLALALVAVLAAPAAGRASKGCGYNRLCGTVLREGGFGAATEPYRVSAWATPGLQANVSVWRGEVSKGQPLADSKFEEEWDSPPLRPGVYHVRVQITSAGALQVAGTAEGNLRVRGGRAANCAACGQPHGLSHPAAEGVLRRVPLVGVCAPPNPYMSVPPEYWASCSTPPVMRQH